MADTYFPKVDYGQGESVWKPATRGPVYQAIERARTNPAFALNFCVDIMYGKEETGHKTYHWRTWSRTYLDERGKEQVRIEFDRTRHKTMAFKGSGWLYNENTLNAAKTWVASLFGLPGLKHNNTWYLAVPCGPYKKQWGKLPGFVPEGVGTFTFVAHAPIEDSQTIRMLNEGHYAFTATDSYGQKAYVTYSPATNAVPLKEGRGRIEAENGKRQVMGKYWM